jgi:6-phosphofructokinase 1
MARPKNAVIAQSGGPTPVINNTLRGIIEGCGAYPDRFGTLYAGLHGIEGILAEQLLNLSAQDEREIQLLRTTPAAGSIGTCRYKLKSGFREDFDRVIEVFRAHGVGVFFYIGGNDSMDTAAKISALANQRGLDLIAVGVSKTIDNDVGDSEFKLVDHTPGYGSVARYWALNIQNANEENRGSSPSDPVLVIQVMGRKIGFIPAAARLADPGREMPLLIVMPESGLSVHDLADRVDDTLARHGRAVVVVSEGFDVGGIGEAKDAFGHTAYGSSETTVQQVIVNFLNRKGLKVRGAARGQVPGTDQRHSMVYASPVDLEEAYAVGQNAVRIAVEHGTGYMSTILRAAGPAYTAVFDRVPLEAVANSERAFPAAWIAPNRVDVTDDFVRYARPLIGEGWVTGPLEHGLQRFSRFKPVIAEKRLTSYTPQGVR